MKSIIEFNINNCSFYNCCLYEEGRTYYAPHAGCVLVCIQGDFRDMTSIDIEENCLMEIQKITKFFLDDINKTRQYIDNVSEKIMLDKLLIV